MNDLSGSFSTATNSQTPLCVSTAHDWRKIAACYACTLALKSDGTLWGWGRNVNGQLAQPILRGPFIPPCLLDPGTTWLDVSAGMVHCLALRTDGSLWAWGQNNSCGELGDGTTLGRTKLTRIGADNDWRAIAVGAFNSFALKRNGTLWAWGFAATPGGPNDLIPRQLDSSTNWLAISASDFSLLALKTDGTLWVRGQNASLTAPAYARPGTDSPVQIGIDRDWREVFAGQSCLYARKRDGSWWICGANWGGELGLPRHSHEIPKPVRLAYDFDPWAFAAGYSGNCLLLARDGTLWTWGQRLDTARANYGWTWNLKSIANRVLLRFIPGFNLSPQAKPIIDTVPHKLWEFPSPLRDSLLSNGARNVLTTNNSELFVRTNSR